ncbi:MAG TPA: tetratricopeptide repeat protein [Anaeromyxobacteraceae bacterium]|nr:tetratricopeptide repeat protein [Anaeromyxobacteraceae bacterium]
MRIARLAALLVALCGCASAPRPPSPEHAAPASPAARAEGRAGFEAYLVKNDPAAASRLFEEALKDDPGEPVARYGAALLARRRLDASAEVAHLAALIELAPAHPLAAVAARRLGELAELSPPLAQAAERELARAAGRAHGIAAARMRSARTAAAVALGEEVKAASLRSEEGAVSAFTLVGPFGALHALEIDKPFPPEQGTLPASSPSVDGLPPVPARAFRTPEGSLALEGEPLGSDLFYLATDIDLARGGDYLVTVGSASTLRVFLDGLPLSERRAYASYPPIAPVVPVALKPGRHRLLVKIGRGSGPAWVGAFVARADGAPSDATFSAPGPGPAVAVREGKLPKVLDFPQELRTELAAEMGRAAACLTAAHDAMESDRESAKGFLEEGLAAAPESAALLAERSEARREDPTLSERIARARAEADLDQALTLDPGDASARLRRADLYRTAGQLDAALSVLDGLSEADASRPRALLARARLAQARGLTERAEQLAEEARRTGADCEALELLLDSAIRRDAIAEQDELSNEFVRCPGGRIRLVDQRRRRGDLEGALAAQDELVRLAPSRIDLRMARANLTAARGDPRAAAAELAELGRLWPRDARVEKRRAEFLEAAGDLVGAREARAHALLLEGGDLPLERAIALESGKEPLEELDQDGLAAIAAYRAAPSRMDTSSVTVLDFGAVEVHPGGALTERIHTVVEARDQRAVDHVGEVTVPEGAELLLARTVKQDGRVLEPEEPLGDKRTLSLTGLEPGDFAEWTWVASVPARGAAMPGFTADTFYFRADTPLWRSTYVAVAPLALGLEVDAHHMPAPTPAVEGGRSVVRVTREQVPPLFPEPNAAGDAELVPFVQVGAGARQEDLARAMGDALLESFRPSREVRALAEELRAKANAASGETLARIAYRRVDEVVLGQGGSFGEPASAILSRGRGSRTVLLKSLFDALGVKSRLALVRDFTRDPAPYRFPRPDLYPYPLLRVEDGAKVQWLDPSNRLNPYGVLPDAVHDAEALLLPGPGEKVEVVRTPPVDPSERRTTRLEVTLDAEGGAALTGTEEYRGYEAASLRASLERLDGPARRQALEQALARSFRSPSLSEVEVEGESALDAPLKIRWRARVEHWARMEEDRAVVDLPVFPALLRTRFLQRARRETPLLVAGDERTEMELSVTPPPGFSAVPVPGAHLSTPFGRYTRAERAEKGRLLRLDHFDLFRGRVPPSGYRDFADFAGEVDAAQEVPMVFSRSTQGPLTPSQALPQAAGR